MLLLGRQFLQISFGGMYLISKHAMNREALCWPAKALSWTLLPLKLPVV